LRWHDLITALGWGWVIIAPAFLLCGFGTTAFTISVALAGIVLMFALVRPAERAEALPHPAPGALMILALVLQTVAIAIAPPDPPTPAMEGLLTGAQNLIDGSPSLWGFWQESNAAEGVDLRLHRSHALLLVVALGLGGFFGLSMLLGAWPSPRDREAALGLDARHFGGGTGRGGGAWIARLIVKYPVGLVALTVASALIPITSDRVAVLPDAEAFENDLVFVWALTIKAWITGGLLCWSLMRLKLLWLETRRASDLAE